MPPSKLLFIPLLVLMYLPVACAGIAPPLPVRPPQPVFAVCDQPSGHDRDTGTVQSGQALHLTVGEGARQHTLVVPANVAPVGTRFVLEQVPGSNVQVNAEAYPDQTFPSEVILSLGFAGCRAPGKPDEKLQMFRFNTTNGYWEPRASQHDTALAERVILRTDHLSGYLLGAAD